MGRNAAALETVAQSARKHSPQVLSYQADLSTDDGLDKLNTALKPDCESLDGLIDSAGIFAMGTLETASLADFDRQYRPMCAAPYALTQSLLPMLRAQHGSVIFINSTAGMDTRASISQYFCD